MAFVFYDTETTGTETDFDQIVQFAAIRTDDNLNELEGYQLRCRLLPYIVPHPGALATTKIRPATLRDAGLPSHYEAMCSLRAKLLEWSPATFVGYNSLPFDKSLLRQAFFGTLNPIYLTNTGGNTRADILRIAQATAIYAPDAIDVPVDAKGKNTFKLDRLAPANGHAHDGAHEAMADVQATIFMARRIRERAPDLWRALIQTTSKAASLELVQRNLLLCATEVYFGRAYSWLITYCGQNPESESIRRIRSTIRSGRFRWPNGR